MRLLLKLLKKDITLPTAVGLEHEGDVLLKPYCPPYYPNMEEAMVAFVDKKFAPGKGIFRDGGVTTAWRDGKKVQDEIPEYSDITIAATIAYCEYVTDAMAVSQQTMVHFAQFWRTKRTVSIRISTKNITGRRQSVTYNKIKWLKFKPNGPSCGGRMHLSILTRRN